MDALTLKAYESLIAKVLPSLLEALRDLAALPYAEREADPALAAMIGETMELLSLVKPWAAGEPSSAPLDEQAWDEAEGGPPPTDEMSDAEATRLLAAMDGLASHEASPLSPSGMSDAEARRLLATMEGSAAGDEDAISDAEALSLLAAMDGPISAGADAASPPLAKTSPIPAPTTTGARAGGSSLAPLEELVEEIAEFGTSEFGADPDMIKDFLTNADDLLSTLDGQILQLEQEPNNREIIEEIFRAAHTLKGAAGMFAFQAIERVMHRMENFFDQVRKGKQTAHSDAIDVILKAMDVLRSLVEAVRAGRPSGIKTAPIVDMLSRLCAGVYKRDDSASANAGAETQAHNESLAKHGNKSRKIEQSTIRVDLQRLDALVNLVGELVIDRTRFVSIEDQLRTKQPSPILASNMTETVQLFGRHMNEIQDIIMKVRMVPIGNAFNKFPRVVRDLAKSLGKDIDLVIDGENTELDKTLVEQIGDPLVHLIRNAVDHGIETPADRIHNGKSARGKILLSARQEGNQILISIEDDGKGMDREKLRLKGIERGLISEDDNLSDRDIFNLIFEAGFSTAEKVTNISGRGVGMDVVKKQISKLKGIVDIASTVNVGSTISIQLPLTLAIVQSLLVKTRDEVFAIPLSAVVESLRIKPSEVQKVGDAEVIKRRNMVLPLLHLHEALDLDKKGEHAWYTSAGAREIAQKARRRKLNRAERLFVVVVGNAERRFGIVVDTLLNQQEMVIKPMGSIMQGIPCVAGGAILGNGEVVLVLDIAELEVHFRSKVRNQAA